MTLAERLIRWREAKGLSLRELARRCGVSHSAVADWESGSSHPLQANLATACDVLGISLETFWGVLPEPRE